MDTFNCQYSYTTNELHDYTVIPRKLPPGVESKFRLCPVGKIRKFGGFLSFFVPWHKFRFGPGHNKFSYFFISNSDFLLILCFLIKEKKENNIIFYF
jgi:hypothetical protein